MLDFHTYPKATHNFDDPNVYTENPDNVAASADAQIRAKRLFKQHWSG